MKRKLKGILRLIQKSSCKDCEATLWVRIPRARERVLRAPAGSISYTLFSLAIPSANFLRLYSKLF